MFTTTPSCRLSEFYKRWLLKRLRNTSIVIIGLPNALQEDREMTAVQVEALQLKVTEYKEALAGTRREMRHAARTLKTYEVHGALKPQFQ